jgi:hypothetical protein
VTSAVDFSEILAEAPVLEKVTEKYQAIATSLNSAQTKIEREKALRQLFAFLLHRLYLSAMLRPSFLGKIGTRLFSSARRLHYFMPKRRRSTISRISSIG